MYYYHVCHCFYYCLLLIFNIYDMIIEMFKLEPKLHNLITVP